MSAQEVLNTRFQELATKADMTQLESDMREMEYRIIIRLGGLMMAGFSTLAILMKWH